MFGGPCLEGIPLGVSRVVQGVGARGKVWPIYFWKELVRDSNSKGYTRNRTLRKSDGFFDAADAAAAFGYQGTRGERA